jgi:protein tyrosine phosphatase (PTP) superfamily phosphohydrolase (DUF442 family)
LYVGPQFNAAGKRAFEREGITAVVNLRTEFDDAAHGLAFPHYCYLPTVDDDSPSPEHFQRGVDFIQAQIAAGGKVYIHCKAGSGAHRRWPPPISSPRATASTRHRVASNRRAPSSPSPRRRWPHCSSMRRDCAAEDYERLIEESPALTQRCRENAENSLPDPACFSSAHLCDACLCVENTLIQQPLSDRQQSRKGVVRPGEQHNAFAIFPPFPPSPSA